MLDPNVIAQLLIPAAKIAALLFVAVIVETLTEYLFAMFPLPIAAPWRKIFVNLIAACLGIGVSLYYGLDFLHLAWNLSPQPTIPGMVLTGLLMSRGASVFHDVYKKTLQAYDVWKVVNSEAELDEPKPTQLQPEA